MSRKEYEMTDAQMAKLMEASKPVPYMVIGGHLPTSPQENANRAWQYLGDELGFDVMTVKPVHGKANTFFTAEEKESEKEEQANVGQ